MDIVYPIKKTTFNEELRYSLRSLENIPHNKVFIIGDLPEFVNEEKVYYIPAPKLESRYKTTTNHLKLAILNDNISEDFIWMNDDFFILKPILEEHLILNRGLFRDQVASYHKNHHPLTNFDKLVENAMIQLKHLGFTNPISFELHCPIIINKENFKAIEDKINSDALHCCKRSVYGNYFMRDSKPIEDVKVLSKHIFREDIQGQLPFISVSECCFNKIKPFLEKKFPNKCKYEK